MGTSAYKLERYENHTTVNTQNSKATKNKSRASEIKVCRNIIAAVAALFVACSALVYVNVLALRATTKIDNLEKQLALVVDKNKQKEIEINQNLDMKVIEKKAIEKLGMQKPDNSQIVYINVKKGTYSEAVNPKKQSSKEAFSGVKEILLSIKEYFS